MEEILISMCTEVSNLLPRQEALLPTTKVVVLVDTDLIPVSCVWPVQLQSMMRQLKIPRSSPRVSVSFLITGFSFPNRRLRHEFRFGAKDTAGS